MRDEARRWQWSASAVLMAVIGVAFVLQQIPPADFIYSWLALSADGLRHGFVWQLLTFQFLHAGFWHLAGNFLKLYFAAGLAGGLLQSLPGLAFENRFGGPVIGASAGVIGLFAAFAMLEPDAEILLPEYLLNGVSRVSLSFTRRA